MPGRETFPAPDSRLRLRVDDLGLSDFDFWKDRKFAQFFVDLGLRAFGELGDLGSEMVRI